MKNTFIKIAALTFVVSLASCKKERTCTCTNTTKTSGSTVSVVSNSTTTYKKISGKSAKGACASYEDVYQQSNETVTETHECSLD